jgi:hypothetical protein
MELFETGHEIKYFDVRRVATGVIFLCRPDDQINDAGKAAAAATALGHGMIHFRRNDKLPTVLIEQFVDDGLDLVISDVITAADQHGSTQFIKHDACCPVFPKEDVLCQDRFVTAR